MSRITTLLSHLTWWGSSLPGFLGYKLATNHVEATQRNALQEILKQNQDCQYGKKHGFDQISTYEEFRKLPLQEYEQIETYIHQLMTGERHQLTDKGPILLEPTGGSSGGLKLIPYTTALKKEFQRAIDPWIFSLFSTWPSLLFGKHYWSITPQTNIKLSSKIPIGFDNDAAYLGTLKSRLFNCISAVPNEIKECPDPATCEYMTLLFLLKEKDLKLISIWHPSYLTILISTLKNRFAEILLSLETGKFPSDILPPPSLLKHLKTDPARANDCRQIGCIPTRLWPKLKLISCWAGESHRLWIDQLKSTFPNVIIQPKGLVATEGITSFPLGNKINQLAINSHFYEFECETTKTIYPLWKIETGKTYHLLLTTGGGLYRYKTHDLIRKTGPLQIQFITRNNCTSDLVGEKISLEQAEIICRNIPYKTAFAFIAPEEHKHQFRYVLYADLQEEASLTQLQTYLETELSKNYHYTHARNLRQLAPSIVCPVDQLEKKMIAHLAANNHQWGSIKLLALNQTIPWKSTFTSKDQ